MRCLQPYEALNRIYKVRIRLPVPNLAIHLVVGQLKMKVSLPVEIEADPKKKLGQSDCLGINFGWKNHRP